MILAFTPSGDTGITSVTLTTLYDATGNAVSFTGGTFTLVGSKWQYSFTGTSTAYTYTVTIVSTVLGTYGAGPITQSNPSAAAQGMYIAQGDLELYIGSITDGILSDPNNSGTLNVAGVQQCINEAEARANQKMNWTGLCQYTVPIVFTGTPDYEFCRQLYDATFCNLIKKRMLLTTQDVDTKQIMADFDAYFESIGHNETKLANAQLTGNPPPPAIAVVDDRHRRRGYGFGYGLGIWGL